jgi:uncharacterized membrane protein YdjX (TVP38/TMEM64 family)
MLLSRHYLTKFIKKRFLVHHSSFMAIDSVISSDGWRTVFLIRMTPLPFAVSSYLLGVTSVRLRDYIKGTIAVSLHVALWLYIG